MKFKDINWIQHPVFETIQQGMVGDQELFSIENVSKKDQVFKLKSTNPKSKAFPMSSSIKELGEFRTMDLAKIEAKLLWEEFTSNLLFVELQEPVTNLETVS